MPTECRHINHSHIIPDGRQESIDCRGSVVRKETEEHGCFILSFSKGRR